MVIQMDKKGFTLVELLAVIAILGILMTVAGVSVIAVLNNQRNTLGLNMERDLKEAAISYVQEKSIYLKTCSSSFNPQNPSSSESSCYKVITAKEIISLGLFEDNKDYCKKEEKIIVYKENIGSYKDFSVYMPDKMCRE